MATILDTLYVEGTVTTSVSGRLIGSVDEMPRPSASAEGFVVLYTGEDTEEWEHCSYYICLTDDDVTFQWKPLVLALDKMQRDVENSVKKDTKINGHPLEGDIELTAEDVHAIPDTVKIPKNVTDLHNDGVWIDQDVSTLANYTTTFQLHKLLEGFVKIIEVDVLPEKDIRPNSIYALKNNDSYKLYIRLAGKWIEI